MALWAWVVFAAGPALGGPPDPPQPPGAAAAEAAEPATPYGVFYDRHEPTFYTGFAPRSSDPTRIHLHMGRGNQLRVTVVLSDEVLETYLRDLVARHHTFRSLIDAGDVDPTQNAAFASFEDTLRELELAAQAAGEDGLPADQRRERNLALMERLNPGRVFRIRMPIDELVGRWLATAAAPDADRDPVVLLDALLPTRVFTDRRSLDAETKREIEALVAQARALSESDAAGAVAALREPWLRLFGRVTGGHYPPRGDALEFAEFTAIYPIGSANEFTTHAGRRIPLYPTPGRRRLMTHQRSRTIDHIAEVPTYSYSPWIPYMHVGSKLHNAFHTPYWVLRLDRASFLPDALRRDTPRGPDGDPYRFAYLLSRGPASHGCTHVNPGHLVELRQLLPSEPEALADVEVFINRSDLFDVFDVDGDLQPEVMGVRYFVAYSIVNDRPGSLYAPVEREPFYDWLYGGELDLDAEGRGSFAAIRDATFAGARAEAGSLYPRVPLYEATYEPERIQFYAPRPISFVRELRKIGVHHPFSRERAKSERAL